MLLLLLVVVVVVVVMVLSRVGAAATFDLERILSIYLARNATTEPPSPLLPPLQMTSAYPPAEGHGGDGEWGEIELEGARGVQGEGGDEEGGVWEEEGADGGEDEEERDPGVDLALLRGAVMMVSRAMRHEEWKNG